MADILSVAPTLIPPVTNCQDGVTIWAGWETIVTGGRLWGGRVTGAGPKQHACNRPRPWIQSGAKGGFSRETK
jgi:hypothetical protein